MNYPLVSVICLCYNHRSYLQEAMESVLSQTYSNLQVIIVDDASGDGSQELIKEFIKYHDDIQTVFLPDNVG